MGSDWGESYSQGRYFVGMSAVAPVSLRVATLPWLSSVAMLTLSSLCFPVPPAHCSTVTVLVLVGIPFMALGHSNHSTLPSPMCYFLPLSSSETLGQSSVWTPSSRSK